jgi:hypothetical protein
MKLTGKQWDLLTAAVAPVTDPGVITVKHCTGSEYLIIAGSDQFVGYPYAVSVGRLNQRGLLHHEGRSEGGGEVYRVRDLDAIRDALKGSDEGEEPSA